MGYVYEASDEEREAAMLLRERGWRVNEPACPDCRGAGFVNEVPKTNGAAVTKCPRGCELLAFYRIATTMQKNIFEGGWRP